MVSFEEIQTAYYMVAATGVLIAAVFYILNLRISQRNQKETLQTRQAQLLFSLQKDMTDYQGWLRYRELMYMKWDSYEDFENKYGSNNNPTSYAMRLAYWVWCNNLGMLLKRKLIDEDDTYDSFGSGFIMQWIEWEPIIKEQRRRYMGSNWMENWEYAADRMRAVQKRRGISWEPPETSIRYVPDATQ